MTKIAVLVSGGGTNLQALIDAQQAGKIENGQISLVISSNPKAYALERAAKAAIPSEVLRRKDFSDAEEYGKALTALLENADIGLIVLAGFMTVLPDSFCRHFENRIINVHPSLIPSFCGEGFYGLRVHEAALAKGVKVTGATVHFVSEVVDGGAIIAQKAVEVEDGDTPETLQKRVMQNAEWILLPQAVSDFCAGRLRVDGAIVHKLNRSNSIMSKNVFDISQELMSNAYPGRGIILGRTPDNKKNVIAYFIMGRSENSRNRVFTETEDGIRTEAFDPSKMVDPSLIIYHPVRLYNGTLVVTNGDQTDTIVDYLKQGKSYFEALRTRAFEPDAPNYTSRISGVVNPDGSYSLSILKNFTSDRTANKRFFYEYDKPVAGLGHFIHTYQCDGDPLPPFRGEPKCIRIELPIREFTNLLWNSLNEQNKVSLFVRYVDLETGEVEQEIRNKHQD